MSASPRIFVALFLVLAQLVPVGFATAATCELRAASSCCAGGEATRDAASCCHAETPETSAPDVRAPTCTCCATPPPSTPPSDAAVDAVVVGCLVTPTISRPRRLDAPPAGRALCDARPAPRPKPRPSATSVFLL